MTPVYEALLNGQEVLMQIAICDDDLRVCSYIENYLDGLKLKDIDYDVFASGSDLINYLHSNDAAYQVYFLDIEMEGYNGIETAEIIRRKDRNALVIFMTQHKEYVYKVFEVLPFRFLVKPVCEENLSVVFNDALSHLQTIKQIFAFVQDRSNTQVYMNEIMYFESIGRKISIAAEGREYLFYGKMHDVYSRLNHILFVQTHASFIVNMDYISVIRDKTITMKDDRTLPVSRRYRDEVKEQYFQYLEWRCGK